MDCKLPVYQCHKRVHADKIVRIDQLENLTTVRLMLTEGRFVDVDQAYVSKHHPQVGGYFVQYEDGYLSFSPAKAFEDGYALVHPTRPNPAHGAPKPAGHNPVA